MGPACCLLPPAAWRLPALGVVIGGALIGIAALGNLREHLTLFVALFAVAFAAYLAAVWLGLRKAELTAGRRLWPLLCLALAYRLILLPAAPSLSDDLYRYAWEGRVLAAGFSPYRYAPSDPALAPLRDATIWPRVNNPDVPSPYPPLAQVAALLGALVGAGGAPPSLRSLPGEREFPSAGSGPALGVKLAATAGDLAVMGATLALLAATGRPPAGVLVYAWHPLAAIAFSHSGHNDALMVAPLALSLALAARGRRWLPAVLLAVASLAKVTPLLLLPLLPRRLGLAPALLAGALFALGWVPLLLLGGGATGSLATYLEHWADNDSLHAILRLALGARGAKAVCLLLLLAGLALLALHPVLRRRPLWWQAYVALGLSIVLASTVHSWYLTWLLPLLAVQLAPLDRVPFLRPGPALGWLLFSGLVALPYLTYDTHEWRLWISFAEYAPLFACLAAGAPWPALRTLLARRARPPAPMPRPAPA